MPDALYQAANWPPFSPTNYINPATAKQDTCILAMHATACFLLSPVHTFYLGVPSKDITDKNGEEVFAES